MNRLLMLGIFVLIIGISAAALAFHFLPSDKDDSATGALTGGTTEEKIAEDAQNAEPQKTETKYYPDQVKEGMTMDTVKELAGEPLEKQTVTSIQGNTVEYWYYYPNNKTWQIAFSDNRVSAIRKYFNEN